MVSEEERDLRARLNAGVAPPEDYRQLANLLKAEGRLQEAVAVYEEALQKGSRGVQIARLGWELAELLYYSFAKSSEAALAAERAVEVLRGESDTRECLLIRGLCYSLLSQARREDELQWLQRAVQTLETVLAQAGDDTDTAAAEYELARCCYELRHTDRSIALCRAYLRRDLPGVDRHLALTILAESLLFERRLGEAEEAVREALEYAAADTAGLFNSYVTLGVILRAAGRPGDARSAFETALELVGDRAHMGDIPDSLRVVYQNLGELYYRDREFERAIAAFRALLSIDSGPSRHRILNWLGTCCAALGRRAEARQYYQQVLASAEVSDVDKADAEAGLSNTDILPEDS